MPIVNLLIVEDDLILAKQLKLFFRSKGYNVVVASTRGETLETIEGFTPHVCILDLGLPPLENSPDVGLSLIPTLVNIGAKVIVLTGQTDRNAAVQAIAQGAFDFIYKPADPQVLDIAVNRAIFVQEIEKEIHTKEGTKIVISRNPHQDYLENQSPLAEYTISQGLNELKTNFEKELVERALKSTGFNVVRAAKILRISRESLYYLMKKHGIKRPS